MGNDCVVGNSTELKNVILFDNVQVPHYNYVGDSILGYKSHMGAGSITSNVKSDKLLVVVKDGAEQVETGRKKGGRHAGRPGGGGLQQRPESRHRYRPGFQRVSPRPASGASSRPAMSIRTRTISSQRNELTELGRRSAQPQFFQKSRRNERRLWAAPINSAMRPENDFIEAGSGITRRGSIETSAGAPPWPQPCDRFYKYGGDPGTEGI